jgi:hypothetical protein
MVTLYYPNDDLTDILAFSQPITATDALYEEIMRALLSGTAEGYVSPFSQGVTCRNIMLLQNILYIDMSWQFNEMPKENFFACISVLVATYTGFSEVSFVNLTVEGKQITLPENPEHPIMLLSRYTGTIQSLNNHYSRHAETEFSGIETFYGAVYVADETNKCILPQVSGITVREKGYATALVSHLLAESTAIFPAGFMLSGEPKYDGKKETLIIDLICPDQWNYSEGWLGASALVSTLDSLYSEIDTLKLTVKTKPYGYLGHEMAEILDANGIVCEFADPDFLVLMLTPEISESELNKLLSVLVSIPKKSPITVNTPEFFIPEIHLSPRAAMLEDKETLPLEQAIGRTLGAVNVACPPAVPILVMGEVINEKAADCFKYYGINSLKVVKISNN